MRQLFDDIIGWQGGCGGLILIGLLVFAVFQGAELIRGDQPTAFRSDAEEDYEDHTNYRSPGPHRN